MNEYQIKLKKDVAVFYEKRAKLSGKSIEQILSDSLYKMCEILVRHCINE